jgi:putative FmdB family regulatory protein
MPTYDYECQKCGHRFEEFQSMTAKPLQRCPKCRGKLKRLIGAGAGLLFKGTGFHATDYRKPGYQEKKKSDSAPTSGGGSGSAKSEPGKSTESAKKPDGAGPARSSSKKAKGD